MKRRVTETFLSRLDDALRWTGIPARVADQMSEPSWGDRNHRPLRWVPIWWITLSCTLFILSVTWPFSPILVALVPSLSAVIVAMGGALQMVGPLGKPSPEDDEREAALRKDAFLVCFGVIASINVVGQPLLVILATLQHWQIAHGLGVAISALMLNLTLFQCLPTLYASWKSPHLP